MASVPDWVARRLDSVVEQYVKLLVLKLDGCESTYCVLMRMDNVATRARDLAEDFGLPLRLILERVLTHPDVVNTIAATKLSLSEAEQLLARPQFRLLAEHRDIVMEALSYAVKARPGQQGPRGGIFSRLARIFGFFKAEAKDRRDT